MVGIRCVCVLGLKWHPLLLAESTDRFASPPFEGWCATRDSQSEEKRILGSCVSTLRRNRLDFCLAVCGVIVLGLISFTGFS